MTTNNSDNTINDNPKVIKLKQSKQLEDTRLVTKSIFYIDTHSVRISLNHSANGDILFTIDEKKWQNNLDIIDKQAEENGINDKNLKKLLRYHLNDNHDEILKGFSNTATNGANSVGEEQEKEKCKYLPQILVELALENHIKLLKDEYNVPQIIIIINNHYETLPIDSKQFRRYLHLIYSDTNEGRIANSEAINSAIAKLEAKAFYEGQKITLHLRVAWDNPDITNTIYYDLADEKNRSIKITEMVGKL